MSMKCQMESLKQSCETPMIPGFDVSRNTVNSLILTAKRNYPCDKMWLSLRLHGARSDLDIGEIDLSQLSKVTDHEDMVMALLPLLTKEKIVRIVFPNYLVHIARGACRGAVMETIREKMGSEIQLADKTVPIRDVVMTDRLLNKITGSSTTSAYELSHVVQVLQEVRTQNDVPHVLRNAIIKAARHIKTITRNRYRTQEKDRTATRNEEDRDSTNSACSDDSSEETDKDNNDKLIPILTKRNNKIEKPTGPLPPNVLSCLGTSNVCYVCKSKYSYPKKAKKVDMAWCQFPRMCHCCAVLNFTKRNQRTNLTGRYAVVTGGRIKIGYHIVLKLLRDGAHVIATTRFPRDAAKRFQVEADFETFKDRLKIYPLDMKSLPSVYAFIDYVTTTFPHLDILINNAAQTISRPFVFYKHLLDYETQPVSSLSNDERELLAVPHVLNYYGDIPPGNNGLPRVTTPSDDVQCPDEPSSHGKRHHSDDSNGECDSTGCKRLKSSKRLPDEPSSSAVRLKLQEMQTDSEANQVIEVADSEEEPADVSVVSKPNSSLPISTHFPSGELDADGQQLDLRPMNTWRQPIDEVPLTELLQVLAINAVAPFILTQRLKPLMDKSPYRRRFIVNVSAMEGQFNRVHKNHFHPHTNMAKAALNMMTRTVAMDYKNAGVFMTAVDTGWVTDERPFPQAQHEQQKGFMLPLDVVDGAARVYDPIVCGLNETEEPYYAVFLKDYRPYRW